MQQFEFDKSAQRIQKLVAYKSPRMRSSEQLCKGALKNRFYIGNDSPDTVRRRAKSKENIVQNHCEAQFETLEIAK